VTVNMASGQRWAQPYACSEGAADAFERAVARARARTRTRFLALSEPSCTGCVWPQELAAACAAPPALSWRRQSLRRLTLTCWCAPRRFPPPTRASVLTPGVQVKRLEKAGLSQEQARPRKRCARRGRLRANCGVAAAGLPARGQASDSAVRRRKR
jgi:hypothetical protein